MKAFANFILIALLFTGSRAAADDTHVYGLHLFFDEREFVDVLTIRKAPDGSLEGEMHVPRDFDGPLSNLKVSGSEIEFDLFVPKNASRPLDLVFHYTGRFFDHNQDQMVGFVSIKGSPAFTASFVGFKRKTH